MKSTSIREYEQMNREWLEELAVSGNRIVRAMALAILKVAGDSDELD